MRAPLVNPNVNTLIHGEPAHRVSILLYYILSCYPFMNTGIGFCFLSGFFEGIFRAVIKCEIMSTQIEKFSTVTEASRLSE